MRPSLVIMAKYPVAGAVKTRLARDLGVVHATYFYRTMLRNIILRLGHDPRWQTILAVSPVLSLSASFWPSHLSAISQGSGDLGARMQRIFNQLPKGPVIIIGTDIPQISAPVIAHAFRKLASHDAIIGPSDDGGYWMIGQTRSPKPLDIFSNVRWSTAHTLADTLANLNERRVAMVETLCDVDNGAEYQRLKNDAARNILLS